MFVARVISAQAGWAQQLTAGARDMGDGPNASDGRVLAERVAGTLWRTEGETQIVSQGTTLSTSVGCSTVKTLMLSRM